MTLNQIIKIIQTEAEKHKQVNKFAVGAEFDFAVAQVEFYPIVWLMPNGFNFSTENRVVDYQFSIMVMDRTFEDSSNTIEVLSDTALIVIDLITLLKRRNENFEIIVANTAEPFYDSGSDVVAGHAIDITIRTAYLESYCDIPT